MVYSSVLNLDILSYLLHVNICERICLDTHSYAGTRTYVCEISLNSVYRNCVLLKWWFWKCFLTLMPSVCDHVHFALRFTCWWVMCACVRLGEGVCTPVPTADQWITHHAQPVTGFRWKLWTRAEGRVWCCLFWGTRKRAMTLLEVRSAVGCLYLLWCESSGL